MSNSLDEAMKNLKGFAKKGARAEKDFIPTGHFELDFAIRYGMLPTNLDLNRVKGYDPSKPLGLPLGRLVEIFGPEGGGKSSMCYRVAGYAQRMINKSTKENNLVAWIDTEHSFSSNLAVINGCDEDKLLYSNLVNSMDPDKDYHAEDVIDNICKMCQLGVKVIILDSVANLVPKARGESSAEDKFVGLLPRLLSENLGKMMAYAEKYGTLLIFINQLRKDISKRWGDPDTSPGGYSLKHNASIRLKVSKQNSKSANIYITDPETGEERLIGRYANVQIKKNRLAKPFFETISIPIYYEPYFPDIEEVSFDVGRQLRVITILKGVFKWDGINIEGKQQFIEHVKSKEKTEELIEDIKNVATEKGVILPPQLAQYKSNP